MRGMLIITLMILLSTLVAAYDITETGIKGFNPAIHGQNIAFLTFEDTVEEDLDGDGDTRDNVLQIYSLETKELTNTMKIAEKFSLFGNFIAFEDKSRMLHIYNIETGETTELKTRGTGPSIYNKIIAFVTAEGDEGDLNDDNDDIDDIIRYYDTGSETTINTQEVGTNPLMLDQYLVFQTKESLAEEDYNGDGDRSDTIIRALDIEAEEVLNTKIEGEIITGYKHPLFIIKDEKFWTYDISEGRKEETNIEGNDFAIYQEFVVYENNNELFVHNTNSGTEKSLEIKGKQPAIFNHNIVFVDGNNEIAILHGNDKDEDEIPDFTDNCLNTSNTKQLDKDKDGIGDLCDELFNPEPVAEKKKSETKKPAGNKTPELTSKTTENLDEIKFTTQKEEEKILPTERQDIPLNIPEKKKSDGDPTFWFLVAIGLLAIGLLFYFAFPGWMKKRRKSFGF